MSFWNGIFILSAQGFVIPPSFVGVVGARVLFAALLVGRFAQVKRSLAKVRASLGSGPGVKAGFTFGIALLDIILFMRVVLHSRVFGTRSKNYSPAA